MSVAVVGPPFFVTCFELAGAVGFEAGSGEEVAGILNGLVEESNFKLIIVPERFADDTFKIRSLIMLRGDVTPVFALIPDLTGMSGMRLEELKRIISLAIGAELEL
jgi:vacuolar-type H+-ATPase subunit F/Vma7